MINKCIYNHPPKDFAGKHLEVIAFLVCAQGTKHACDISRVKLPCSSKESFSLDSRVGASSNSVAHGFSISKDSSWQIIVESRLRSRTTFSGPKGRGSNSIGGLGGVSNSDIYMGSVGSSSLMNSSTSFSRRDSG